MSEVNTFIENTTGRIVLDRPKALNSLNLDMVHAIHEALEQWREDDAVTQVLITSGNERAFCAGGDVRSIRQQAIDGHIEEAAQFFIDEYVMNNDIATYPKPYAALLNGVTMGGGLGVSMHGSHRIVTEQLMSSMPEMAIGYLPDVGASWALNRLEPKEGNPTAIALFLGLTAYRLDAPDAVYIGLGTHFVPAEQVADLEAAIIADGVDAALERFATQPEGEPALAKYISHIDEVFTADSIDEVVANLANCSNEEFVQIVEHALKTASPTSMAAAVRVFAKGREVVTPRQALDNELSIGHWLFVQPDFTEGVRAVLVDKDRNPAWQPANLDEVDRERIESLLVYPA